MPATGYYEWHDTAGGKQPYYFSRRDGQPLTIAAVWDTWRDTGSDDMVDGCAMVITQPNKRVAEVHDRMPVILERDHWDTWMRTNDLEEAASLMKPAEQGVLQKWPVSKRVNNNRAPADDPTLIQQVDLDAPPPDNVVAIQPRLL